MANPCNRRRSARFQSLALGLAAALVMFGASAAQAAPAVSAGDRHVLALAADGTVRAWGDDSSGQLGLGRTLLNATPKAVIGIADVVRVSSGSTHVVALKRDGTVWAWGENTLGQLGDGSTTSRATPAPVASLSGVVAIAAGRGHTLALKSDGTVWSWGMNYQGQVGTDANEALLPARVPRLPAIAAIAAGGSHSLALTRDGSVWSWGANDAGQLGDGTFAVNYLGRSEPRPVTALSGIVAIAAGGLNSVAVKSDGTVATWGSNYSGQLGDGGGPNRALPFTVPGLAGVRSVASGYCHTLALLEDGSVRAWGDGYSGQLGDGLNTPSPQPVRVAGLGSVTEITAGDDFSLARTASGVVHAWGHNRLGQLGDATTTLRSTPVVVTGLPATASVASGGLHGFAVAADGRVFAWGSNDFGELGDGVRSLRSSPALVPGATGIKAVAAGGLHSLALRNDGTVIAWGGNGLGQLGDGTQTARSSPVAVAGLDGVQAIAAGYYHSVALKGDGSVWTWGYGYNGQMGNGSNDSLPRPAQVAGLPRIVAIATGPSHVLALAGDGSLWAWGGNNAGQLGDGTTTDRLRPVRVSGVSGLADITAIAAGYEHSLAMTAGGAVWSWGSNYSGQLGDGSNANRSVPGRVAGIASVRSIAAGASFSLALKSDGSLWAWGANWRYQLGDGTYFEQVLPVPTFGPGRLAAIAAGGGHGLALSLDGSAWSWGANLDGRLGDGTFIDRAAPVIVLREGGGGSVAANDWFLDLDPAVPSVIPAGKIPVFLVVAASAEGQYTAALRFRPEDVGSTGSVFVFALAPASLVKAAADGTAPVAMGKAVSRSGAKADGADCVLAQPSPSGSLIAVTAAQLQASQSGVLSAQGASVTVLNSAASPNAAGATFYVGYGANGPAMVANGVYRDVVNVPGALACAPLASPTALWWDPAENGWGVNFAHQGSTLFATLYTYDANRAPLWLVMSNGALQSDGITFSGDLYRSTGPAFNAVPFTPITAANLTRVGTMTATFSDVNAATLRYSVDGVEVRKAIQRLVFGSRAAHCVLTAASRAGATNYQDLWWNAAESGWGVNVTHQDNTLFATLFNYDATGRGLWLVMSAGTRQADGAYQGTLFRASGPPFNANPFTPITAANLTNVGTMRFAFADGERGTLTYSVNGAQVTKAITRLVFASPAPVCN